MFYCNSLVLLTFTYYLKLIIAFSMTIVPFIYLERLVIKILKQKEKKMTFKKSFWLLELKRIFPYLAIFFLALSLHLVIKTPDNVCYKYSQKDIIKEYKLTLKELNKTDISTSVKKQMLLEVILNDTKTDNETKASNESLKVQKIKQENSNYLKETDYTKQNDVYVVDGTFYFPSTYKSGMKCPLNPLEEGYNNPFGYNNYFYSRLEKLIQDANKLGYKITVSNQGCRSYQLQVNYFYSMESGRAASPGVSLHGYGIASDLEFFQANGEVCPANRTDVSCPSMGWAHQHAKEYGLDFSLLYASYKEDWHIEPLEKSHY